MACLQRMMQAAMTQSVVRSRGRCAEKDLRMLFRPLLPPSVLLAEMDPGQADPADIHPEERSQVERAVESRRREYAAGRLLARALLSGIEAGGAPLTNGPDRAPVWPAGIVGSITHCTALCAVAVADAKTVAGIGIDVERAGPLPDNVVARILAPAEREAIARLPLPLRTIADRLVFSAKEAAYKALYPRTKEFLDFSDLHVELDRSGDPAGEFVVTPTRPMGLLPAPVRGRYRVEGVLLATAVVLLSWSHAATEG